MRLIIYISFLLVTGLAEIAAQEYPIRRYTNRDGLIQNQISALYKDRRGFLWLGTKGGVSRFDGQRFENFENKKELYGIHTNQVAEDSKGNIWLLQIERLVKFDGEKTWVFQSDSIKEISHFFIDKNDEVFVKQQNGGLWKLKNGSFHKSSASMASGDNRENYFYHSTTGKLFVSISSGLYLFKDGQLRLLNPSLKSTEFIIESLDHTMYLYSLQPELQITEMDPVNETTRIICKAENQKIKIVNRPKNDLLLHHQNHVYFLDHRTNEVTPVFEEVMVRGAIVEANNRFWVGTERGLVEFLNTGFRSFSDKQVPFAWGVTEDNKGNYWFGNYGHSLQKFDGKSITTENRHHSLLKSALKKASKPYSDDQLNLWYHNPITDRYGKVWLPNGYGVVVKDGEKFWTSINETCFAAFEDSCRNRVILPSCNGKIYMYDNKAPFKYRVLNIPKKFQNGYCALSGTISPNGEYWFVVGGGAYLMRYNSDREEMYFYTRKNKKLPSLGVTEFCFDKVGRFWMGSHNGLWLRDARTDSFKQIGPDTFKSTVSAIALLDNQHLLIGDAEGLRIFDYENYLQKGQIKVKKLDERNGFMGGGAGQSGLYKDSKGQFWIMSGDFLSVLNPNKLNPDLIPLQPYFVSINDSLIPSSAYRDASFKLAEGINSIKIGMSAVGNDHTDKTLYSYKIDELGEDWSPWQTENLIYKNNFESGKYTLRLRVLSEGQVSSGQQPNAVLHFEVDLPFWRSKAFPFWVGFLAFSALGLAVFLFIRTQQIALDLRLQQQEHKIRHLQIQTIQAQMNPHFFFNVLNTLQNLILKQDTEKAYSSVGKLALLMRDFLDASIMSNAQKRQLSQNEISLQKELELLRLYVEFEHMLWGNLFTYEFIIDGQINPYNETLPPLLIQPFVENAINHGLRNLPEKKGGLLWIRFFEVDEGLICQVEDNGVGREEAKRIQEQSGEKRESHGTELIRQRVELLNEMGYKIKIDPQDRVERGTVVTIKINYQI